jgi:REP element-mobilizing transposase RayT
MPNHIHGIIMIDERAEQSPAPTVGDIICTYKSITTKLSNRSNNVYGCTIWQRNYYEHIIRNEKELSEIRQYIFDNPAKWQEDKYFIC